MSGAPANYTGNQIEKYFVQDLLGEGGMGRVYKAWHMIFNLPVVLKFLHPQFVRHPNIYARFLDEARIQYRFNHENIVRVTDIINMPTSHPEVVAMVMDYVDGETLEGTIAAQGSLRWDEAKGLIAQVLSAIGYAHENGVVHRDIKPANMIVGRSRKLKVMDFGVAKVRDTLREATRVGTVMGSLHYMSPEQIYGADSLNHRADIYSLGMTFYEVLTGRVAFEGDDMAKVMYAHINTPPQNPCELNSDVPAGVGEAILRALQKDPDKRWQSCEEFAEALIGDDKRGVLSAVPRKPAAPTVFEAPAPKADAGPSLDTSPAPVDIDSPIASSVGRVPSGNGDTGGVYIPESAPTTTRPPVEPRRADAPRRPEGDAELLLELSELGRWALRGRLVLLATVDGGLHPDGADRPRQIYVFDTETRKTYLISTDRNGRPGTAESDEAHMSPNMRFILFHSRSPDLVAEPRTSEGLYVRDLKKGAIIFVSRNHRHEPIAGPTGRALFDASNRSFVFTSSAPDVTEGVKGGTEQLYYMDLRTATPVLFSSLDNRPGSRNSYAGVYSPDDRWIAFPTDAPELFGAKKPSGRQIVRRAVGGTDYDLISSDSGGEPGVGISHSPVATGDGRKIVFVSNSINLASGWSGQAEQIYMKHLVSREVYRLSTDRQGKPADAASASPAVSPDGALVAFESVAANLTRVDPGGVQQIFVKNLKTGDVVVATVDRAGRPGRGVSERPEFSADGKWLYFVTRAENLFRGDQAVGAQHEQGVRLARLPVSGLLDRLNQG